MESTDVNKHNNPFALITTNDRLIKNVKYHIALIKQQ
jgi:hypothetical protein